MSLFALLTNNFSQLSRGKPRELRKVVHYDNKMTKGPLGVSKSC